MSVFTAPPVFVAPPAPSASAPVAVAPFGPLVVGDEWVFLPVSPSAVAPRGFVAGSVARAAAVVLARAVVAVRLRAWVGRGPGGGWGVFVAAP